MTIQDAEACTILRCVVGSTAHGLQVDDGVEDRDEMGICVEPMRASVGFAPKDTFIYRTAAIREGRQDARSRAGDLDLTIYSLRKFCKLALQGNPTVMLPLYAKPLMADWRGRELQELAPAFASKEAGKRFLGYLVSQKQRLLGERGQKDVKRPELEALYGFDTKYAYHVLRLGFQGIEFLETGRLTLPVDETTRGLLLRVRTGKVTLNEVVHLASALEESLRGLIDTSPLPTHPAFDMVERWMCNVYLEEWEKRRGEKD